VLRTHKHCKLTLRIGGKRAGDETLSQNGGPAYHPERISSFMDLREKKLRGSEVGDSAWA
jgi:hypothetical protein